MGFCLNTQKRLIFKYASTLWSEPHPWQSVFPAFYLYFHVTTSLYNKESQTAKQRLLWDLGSIQGQQQNHSEPRVWERPAQALPQSGNSRVEMCLPQQTLPVFCCVYTHVPPTACHSPIQGPRYRVIIALHGKVLFQTHLLYDHKFPSPCETDANVNFSLFSEDSGVQNG